jgi:hypothetical protein
MSRPEKPRAFYADSNVRGSLTELAEHAGMPRTVAYRALKAGVYAAHYTRGFKGAYDTHIDSAHAARRAWKAYTRDVHIQNLQPTDQSSGSSGK